MATLNYTTSVKADQSIAEVTKLLATSRVASVSTRYDASGQASGLAFSLRTPHGERQFSLDVNIDGVWELLKAEKGSTMRPPMRTRQHAERVAWRVIKDWIEAQLALINAQMATLDQVMLPYLVIDAAGNTVYAAYRDREQTALEVS